MNIPTTFQPIPSASRIVVSNARVEPHPTSESRSSSSRGGEQEPPDDARHHAAISYTYPRMDRSHHSLPPAAHFPHSHYELPSYQHLGSHAQLPSYAPKLSAHPLNHPLAVRAPSLHTAPGTMPPSPSYYRRGNAERRHLTATYHSLEVPSDRTSHVVGRWKASLDEDPSRNIFPPLRQIRGPEDLHIHGNRYIGDAHFREHNGKPVHDYDAEQDAIRAYFRGVELLAPSQSPTQAFHRPSGSYDGPAPSSTQEHPGDVQEDPRHHSSSHSSIHAEEPSQPIDVEEEATQRGPQVLALEDPVEDEEMSDDEDSLAASSLIVSKQDRPHVCYICGKTFPRPSAVKTHLSVHTGERPYKCPIHPCDKTFAVRSNARRHLQTHGMRLKTHAKKRDSKSAKKKKPAAGAWKNLSLLPLNASVDNQEHQLQLLQEVQCVSVKKGRPVPRLSPIDSNMEDDTSDSELGSDHDYSATLDKRPRPSVIAVSASQYLPQKTNDSSSVSIDALALAKLIQPPLLWEKEHEAQRQRGEVSRTTLIPAVAVPTHDAALYPRRQMDSGLSGGFHPMVPQDNDSRHASLHLPPINTNRHYSTRSATLRPIHISPRSSPTASHTQSSVMLQSSNNINESTASTSGGGSTQDVGVTRRDGTWLPTSLLRFQNMESIGEGPSYDDQAISVTVPTPLPPIRPSRAQNEGLGGSRVDERDSYDYTFSETPYHPMEWARKSVLPGPAAPRRRPRASRAESNLVAVG